MATFTETLDDLYITTFQEMRKEIVDNIFAATPFYFWLMKKGGVKEDSSGGKWLGVPLLIAKNDTVGPYQKGGTFSVTRTDKLDLARYDWKYMGGSLIRYKTEELTNRGKAKIIDRMLHEIDTLKLSLIDYIETTLFSDGSGNSGLDFNGLDIICDEDPTSAVTSPQVEVGGIAQASNSFWRNAYRQMDSDGTVIELHMMKSWKYVQRACTNGMDKPDIMVTTDEILDFYEDECLEMKVIENKDLGDAGFRNLTWRGTPIIDSPSCKSGSTYFLNTRYLNWIAQAGANFEMTEWKTAPDTLDRYAQVFVSGNLVTSNRARQGIVFDID
ncbi:hypothetical protein LCGC14_0611340 [marine sediment metagenome]|uniref:Capsid protein n=1 Tax=marine sediment metagenome TaxID=412755 RepID=A0A0F9RRW6_9ZZZZ